MIDHLFMSCVSNSVILERRVDATWMDCHVLPLPENVSSWYEYHQSNFCDIWYMIYLIYDNKWYILLFKRNMSQSGLWSLSEGIMCGLVWIFDRVGTIKQLIIRKGMVVTKCEIPQPISQRYLMLRLYFAQARTQKTVTPWILFRPFWMDSDCWKPTVWNGGASQCFPWLRPQSFSVFFHTKIEGCLHGNWC